MTWLGSLPLVKLLELEMINNQKGSTKQFQWKKTLHLHFNANTHDVVIIDITEIFYMETSLI